MMKKIIPPILFLICIALMIGIRYLVVLKEVIPKPFNYIGIVLILTGLIITIKVRKQFNKADTEIHTFKNPGKLVTDGLFRISRNPIYFGFVISLIGVWILLGTFLPLFGCLLFFLVSNYWYIPYEEQVMEKKFGMEYENYKSNVGRWF